MYITQYKSVVEESKWSLGKDDEKPSYERRLSASEPPMPSTNTDPLWKIEIPEEDWKIEFEAAKEDFRDTLQELCEEAVFYGGGLSEMPSELERPKFLSPVVGNLKYHLENDVGQELVDANVQPDSSDVYIDSGELWMQLWLEEGDDIEKRKSEAMDIIKGFISDYDELTSVVNVGYQLNSDEPMISVWWH